MSEGQEEKTSSLELQNGLRETCNKAEAGLMASIEEHVESSSADFDPKRDGLDFLDTKNTLLLSYLIDLTAHLRLQLKSQRRSSKTKTKNDDNKEESGSGGDNNCLLKRLTEMKVALDKMRGLDKKLRYQIDKLLAAGSATASSWSFATAAGNSTEEDPLQFRPNADALDDDDESSSGSTDDEDMKATNYDDGGGGGDEDQYEDEHDDLDDDLEAARLTLSMAKGKKKKKTKKKGVTEESDDDEEESSSAVYRAPRLAAVPYYAHGDDKGDREVERQNRQRQRLKASEVAQTLRSQYGEAPDQEDMHGGTELGRQREAARRMAQHRMEKTEFEEENFVRLTTSRKERKERERLMRQEHSNLAAIADVVRGGGSSSEFADADDEDDGGGYKSRKYVNDSFYDGDRHANGKRKRQMVDRDGMVHLKKRGSSVKAKNSFQAALYGGGDGVGSKSKKK